ncbi:MAG: sulfite exporter TauE/SafE family protein [Balneolaceae bacterium]|nr:sulfite exporter TauE/SafE family protein [Balneolaceae bacterium]
MDTWTALAIGFFGSFHCIGMCGPIALALPGADDSTLKLITGRTLYNLGRMITYALMGVIFGLIGHSIALAGFQKSLSVILGLAIIASVLIKSSYFKSIKNRIGANNFYERIKTMIAARFKKRGVFTLFSIGLLNGLLPCGFVYLGLAGSLTTGTISGGMLYMALFGLGTFPAMMAMSLAPGLFSLELRRRINKAVPILAVLFGIYLIYRGLFMGSMMHI